MKIKTFAQRNKEKVQAHLDLMTYNYWFKTFLWFPRIIDSHWCWLEYVERQTIHRRLEGYKQIVWEYRMIPK